MNNSNGNQQTEKLKKEQKSIRKVGIVLLILSVVLMLAVSQGAYELVAIPAICAVIGGFLVARSYAHIKYRNSDDQQ